MTDAGSLPADAPLVNAETKPFWDATAEGRLVLPRCDTCDFVIWYPRVVCPACHATSVTWGELSGRGRVYSYTVTRRNQGRWGDVAPYVVAYVELDEGPRLLTNVVGCDPDDVHVDLEVEVVFADTGEGPALPRFRPRS
jgi:uncharacterized protein